MEYKHKPQMDVMHPVGPQKQEYVFEPETLYEAVKKGLGLPTQDMIETVHQELLRLYPGHVAKGRRWIFNVAGGVMGQLTVLHGSPKEYLLFFGSPIGSEGHSGRYKADIWDFCMAGEFWLYVEGQLDRTVVKSGDVVHLGEGLAKGFKMPDHGTPCYMLEYGRGNIPSVLPFGILNDAISSTHDWPAVKNQLMDYAKIAVKEVMMGEMKNMMLP